MTPPPVPTQTPPGLGRLRGLAMAVLVFERVWPAVAPALGMVLVLLTAALLDLPRLLPPEWHRISLGLAGMAVLATLALGLRRVVLPRAREADRRLEADSGLPHQPLSVLTDRAAGPDSALWAAHLARAHAQIALLRLAPPRPVLAAADPWAIRALVLLGLAASLVIAGPSAPLLLSRALHPDATPAAPSRAPVLQAWITPPSYTGLAPVFLRPDSASISVPAGSRLQVNLTGGTDAPTLALNSEIIAFSVLDPTSFQVEADLAHSGHLAIRRRGHEVAGWELEVVADMAPTLRFPEAPGIVRGPAPQTRLPWEAAHLYGVASVEAELKLAARPAEPALRLPIPLPSATPKTAKGVRLQDLTSHIWAGLAVTVQLVGRDVPGHEGRSETVTMTLPERRFTHPVARALITLRRHLTLEPTQRASVIADLERLGRLPQTWESNLGGFLNLSAIRGLLVIRSDRAAVEEAQGRLWTLALALEEGAADRAARALDQARAELRDALEAEKRGAPTDRAEIERKTRTLQEALQNRLEALSDQARNDPTTEAFNPDAHPLDRRDMQKLTEDMREAARAGDFERERQKLAELEEMMDALQSPHRERGKPTERERQRAQRRQRGQEQMSALQDIVRRETAILDHAQARDQVRGPPSLADQQQRERDQQIQQALRRALGELMQQYGDLTGDVPPNLGEADTAMRDAGQALAAGREPVAAAFAQRAITALQKGGQSMRQQMARQFGQGEAQGEGEGDEAEGPPDGDGQTPGDGAGEGEGSGNQPRGLRPGDSPRRSPGAGGRQRTASPGRDRDPLGRPTGEGIGGMSESGDTAVPEEQERARTQSLQEELRRRGADRTRARQELDYIDRLLRPFP